jgi:hypothetical protein
LVWLYFLLAGGVYRKRALQTLAVTAVLGLVAVLWVSHVAPQWVQELHANLLANSALGGPDNPGSTSTTVRSLSAVLDLQSVVTVFRDDPRIYNPVSYLVCGALLLAWSVRTLRSRFRQTKAWLALAAVAPISMLVTYHRPPDAKLLLLAVPACAILWAEGGAIRCLALLVTTAGILSTSDIPLFILQEFTKNMPNSSVDLSIQILTVALLRPAPLILLAMGIFYLWIYVRRDPERGRA